MALKVEKKFEGPNGRTAKVCWDTVRKHYVASSFSKKENKTWKHCTDNLMFAIDVAIRWSHI